MKIKVAASSPKSAGIRSIRNSSSSSSRNLAAAVARATVFVAVLAVVHRAMFATKLTAAAQQVAFKAGRAPRVYNALITSDQRLLPSQADPIVAPVFRPFPFFYNGWPEVYAAPVAPVSSSSTRLVQRLPPAGVAASAAAAAPVPDVSSAPEAAAEDVGPPPPQAAVIKNNKPADTSVPDVPPPPLPVSRAGAAGGKKKPEEFPPPPVSFAI